MKKLIWKKGTVLLFKPRGYYNAKAGSTARVRIDYFEGDENVDVEWIKLIQISDTFRQRDGNYSPYDFEEIGGQATIK